jgi:hypothetical protein
MPCPTSSHQTHRAQSASKTIDAEQFQRHFEAWVASLNGVPAGVVAIDMARPLPASSLSGRAARSSPEAMINS